MPKLTRVKQSIFGSTAGSDQIAQFGSLAAGSPQFTTDPAVIQALSEFTDGWFAGVVNGAAPAIEDMNALHFLMTRQLAYIYQSGIPEYDGSTVYYQNSFVQSGSSLYQAIYGSPSGFSGIAPPNPTYWALPTSSTNWGMINGTLGSQTDLQAALDLKAPLQSPALLGSPTIMGGSGQVVSLMMSSLTDNVEFIMMSAAEAAITIAGAGEPLVNGLRVQWVNAFGGLIQVQKTGGDLQIEQGTGGGVMFLGTNAGPQLSMQDGIPQIGIMGALSFVNDNADNIGGLSDLSTFRPKNVSAGTSVRSPLYAGLDTSDSGSPSTNVTLRGGDNADIGGGGALILRAGTSSGGPSGLLSIGAPATTEQHALNTALGTAASDLLTLTNGPTGTAGNPTGYVSILVNGVARVIPFW